MWVYWILFLVPAAAASIEAPSSPAPLRPARRSKWNAPAVFLAVVIAVLVGFRYSVGGDWGAYLLHFEDVYTMSLDEALSASDPGYALLNWVSARMGWDIYGVNLFCGAVLATGLLRFSISLPRPWLALTVAIPYMVIVVAMGYSRQAVALGFAMLGLVSLQQKSVVRFVVWTMMGAMFHKTAVLLIPIMAFANSRNWLLSVLLAAITTTLGYLTLLQDSFTDMYSNYVGGEMQSEGALVRLGMNGLAAVLLLVWRKRLQLADSERSLWHWLSIISLTMLLALLAFPSASTALDRMALYLLPLQLVVFSRVPDLFGRGQNARFFAALVVLYYAAVQFIWLNYATFASYWIPYRFYLFEQL